ANATNNNNNNNNNNQPLPRRALSIANGTSPHQSPLSSRASGVVSTRKSDKNGGVGSGKRSDTSTGGRSPIKLKFTYPIMDGYIYRLKGIFFFFYYIKKGGTRGELRFRFQLTNAEKFEKVAFIDVFDCEAEQNLQSNIEVSNILRGNFKLVVDQKMQLSNKRLCLRVHCAAKQAANASQKPQPIVFETKKFHVEFTGAQGSNALVKSSKSPNATKVDTKTKVKTDATKKVPKDPNRKIGASSQSKKNKASNKTSAKNIQEHNPKEEKKDTQPS
ncbi:C2H2-type zinc finger-containing protein, partial [Reticulomyxa filosa]